MRLLVAFNVTVGTGPVALAVEEKLKEWCGGGAYFTPSHDNYDLAAEFEVSDWQAEEVVERLEWYLGGREEVVDYLVCRIDEVSEPLPSTAPPGRRSRVSPLAERLSACRAQRITT